MVEPLAHGAVTGHAFGQRKRGLIGDEIDPFQLVGRDFEFKIVVYRVAFVICGHHSVALNLAGIMQYYHAQGGDFFEVAVGGFVAVLVAEVAEVGARGGGGVGGAYFQAQGHVATGLFGGGGRRGLRRACG